MTSWRRIGCIGTTVLTLCAVAACGDSSNDTNAGGGGGGQTTGGSGGVGEGGAGASGGSGGGGAEPATIATAQGTLTITLDGPSACTSTFSVHATEDASALWQCPSCEIIFTGAITVTDGTCTESPSDVLAFGWDAAGAFHYQQGYAPMIEAGTATEDSGSVTISGSGQVPDGVGGFITVTTEGSLTLGTIEGDVLHGWTPADNYECGWPNAPAPEFTGSYAPAIGDVLPDGVFADSCGDNVRLHNLLGNYVVIHANQIQSDCPPCTAAFEGQQAFEDAMAGLGIPTVVVPLLVPSYTVAGLSPTLTELQTWVEFWDPAWRGLADRGYATSVIASAADSPDAFGYPAFLLMAPDGTILHASVGFTTDTWADLQNRIEMDAAP